MTDNGNIYPRIDKSYYNIFTSGKMKMDLQIPSSTINDSKIKNNNGGDTSEQIYDVQLVRNSIYSTTVIAECRHTINISGIQIGYNQDIRNLVTKITPAMSAAEQSWFPAEGPGNGGPSSGEFIDTDSTLPYFQLPGLFGYCCDPINSAIDSTSAFIGNNTIEISTNKNSPALVNIQRSMIHNPALLEDYNNLLIPETINTSYMQGNNVAFRNNITTAVIDYAADLIIPDNYLYSPVVEQRDLHNSALTLNDMNINVENMLSSNNRGQIFTQTYNNSTDKAVYTFSKAVATQNYAIEYEAGQDGTAGQNPTPPTNPTWKIVRDGPSTTTLYSMKIGANYYPTNMKDWKLALDLGIAPEVLFWYYNKPEYSRCGQNINGIVNDFNYGITINTIYTSNQSLIVNIVVPKIRAPLINPLLINDYAASFSNSDILQIKIKLAAQDQRLYNLITKQVAFPIATRKYIYDYTAAGWTNGAFQLNTSTNNIGVGSLTVSDTYITTRMTNSVLGAYKNNVSTIPFIAYDCPVSDTGFVSSEDMYYESSNVSLSTVIPEHILLMFSCKYSVEITKLEIIYNGRSDVMMQDINTLKTLTSQNGINWSRRNDSYGYSFTSNFATSKTMTKNNTNIIGQGTVLMLQYGRDIPIPQDFQACANMSGADLSVQYRISYKFIYTDNCPMVPTERYNLNLFHLNSKNYLISNGVATLQSDMFNISNYMNSVETVKNDIQGGKYTISRARLTGGNFVHSGFSKAKGVVAKLHKHFVDAVATGNDAIQTAATIANTGAKFSSGINRFLQQK